MSQFLWVRDLHVNYLAGFLWLKVSHGISLGTVTLLVWVVVSYGCSTGVRRSASKLTHMAVGRPWFLPIWNLPQASKVTSYHGSWWSKREGSRECPAGAIVFLELDSESYILLHLPCSICQWQTNKSSAHSRGMDCVMV